MFAEIPGSSVRGYGSLSSAAAALQSALCPRRVELSSVLWCMGTPDLGQMQYFPEYFCQNLGLSKQNTVKSQQTRFNQLNLSQQAKCWSSSRQRPRILPEPDIKGQKTQIWTIVSLSDGQEIACWPNVRTMQGEFFLKTFMFESLGVWMRLQWVRDCHGSTNNRI